MIFLLLPLSEDTRVLPPPRFESHSINHRFPFSAWNLYRFRMKIIPFLVKGGSHLPSFFDPLGQIESSDKISLLIFSFLRQMISKLSAIVFLPIRGCRLLSFLYSRDPSDPIAVTAPLAL